ncbi:MAG: DUF3592 domain-containing protein [Planctomycetota bacterium]
MRSGIILTCVGLLLIGGVCLLGVIFDNSDWPTTSGVIESMEVVEKKQNRKTVYSPEVRYSFEVEGKQYFSEKISWMEPVYDSQSQARRSAPYSVGRRVTVYFNASNPSQSLLKPRINLGMHLFFLPIILTVAGIIFTIKGFLFPAKRRITRPGQNY